MQLGGLLPPFLHFLNSKEPYQRRPLPLPRLQKGSLCERAQVPGSQGRTAR